MKIVNFIELVDKIENSCFYATALWRKFSAILPCNDGNYDFDQKPENLIDGIIYRCNVIQKLSMDYVQQYGSLNLMQKLILNFRLYKSRSSSIRRLMDIYIHRVNDEIKRKKCVLCIHRQWCNDNSFLHDENNVYNHIETVTKLLATLGEIFN